MPLVTGADFGLRFPQGNRNDISPIVDALGGMIQEEKQSRLTQQKQQAETLQQAYKATALDLLNIAKKPGLTAKRGAIVDMAKRAKLRGEDTSILSDLLTYTTDDELNTAILGIAHRAGEQDKMLTEAMKAAEPVEQFEPIYQGGQIIAQRNVSTNKVIDDPRAKASQHARNIGKFFQPLTISNAETGEKRLVMPVGDPTTGTAKLADVDLPQGFEISKETPEEQRA
ncbi:MAG: hypothetical protein GY941_25155, partial [Planctomycetes bacterium]|nr:hypothetical protein [Planctomycetota bacterium]